MSYVIVTEKLEPLSFLPGKFSPRIAASVPTRLDVGVMVRLRDGMVIATVPLTPSASVTSMVLSPDPVVADVRGRSTDVDQLPPLSRFTVFPPLIRSHGMSSPPMEMPDTCSSPSATSPISELGVNPVAVRLIRWFATAWLGVTDICGPSFWATVGAIPPRNNANATSAAMNRVMATE